MMTTEDRRLHDRRAQPFDVVEKPKHYNSHPSGVEVKEITNFLEFNLGNTLKYVLRYQEKEPVRSLKSAMWYLNEHREVWLAASDMYRMRWALLLDSPEYATVLQLMLRVIDHEPDQMVQSVLITYRAYVFGGHKAVDFFDLKAALSGLILSVGQFAPANLTSPIKMILCPTCGNKRCPHAADPNLVCTYSNEPGQPGSAYP